MLKKLIMLLKNIAITFVVVQFILIMTIFVYGGKYLEIPGSNPVEADAIVVLGGATGDRLNVGLWLWKKGFSDTILLTGSPGGTSAYYNDWREYILRLNGVKAEQIIKNSSASSSWEEAILVRNMFQNKKWRRVLIVSDPPHTRRLLMTYRQVFKGTNYDYRFIKTSPVWWNPDKWWENRGSGSFVLMELVKLVYYFFGKF